MVIILKGNRLDMYCNEEDLDETLCSYCSKGREECSCFLKTNSNLENNCDQGPLNADEL